MIKQGSRQETETNIVNIEYLYVSKRHKQSDILYMKYKQHKQAAI